MIEKEPEIDSSVLTVYEEMRVNFPEHDIRTVPEKQFKLLQIGLKETKKIQSYYAMEGSLGIPLPADDMEGDIRLYNPFEGIYHIDGNTSSVLDELLDILEKDCKFLDPGDAPAYYMVPFPQGWEKLMPYFLQGVTCFSERMVSDLQKGG